MSRRRDLRTADLFQAPQPDAPLAASMDYRRVLAELVAQALEDADGDRHEIAARMTRLSGREISKYMLDAYAAPARDDHNLPTWLLPVLETACQTHALTNWLAGTRGAVLMIGRDALLGELGREERKLEAARRRVRDLKGQMDLDGADHE